MNPVRPGADVRSRLGGLIDPGVDPDDAWARAFWSTLTEPGDAIAGSLVASVGAVEALAVMDPDAAARPSLPSAIADAERRWRPRWDPAAVAAAVRAAERAGMRLLTPSSPAWPRGLGDLGDHSPHCLWALGDPSVLQAESAPLASPAAAGVAIVGARAATSYGEQVAVDLAAGLAGRGVTVVSGAAYGIDGAAHRAALAVGASTVAVLAGGADRAYPAGHASLLERIARTGVVVSEVPPGSAPTKWRFLQRNRLIAAISAATVVVEAGWRSGSLNTAGHAATLGRPLGAVPGAITSATSAGCHRLLRDYDARCITGVDDVMELLGASAASVVAESRRDADHVRVLDALSTRTPRDPADVARRSGLAEDEARSALGLLSLEGLVASEGAGWLRARG